VSDKVTAALPTVAMRTGGGAAAFLRKVAAIALKDLRAELRGREVFSTMTMFSVLAVIIFGMAFDLRVPDAAMVAPGVLWVIILFGGVLGLNRSFGAEMDRGTLPALLMAPMDRSAIYFGKVLANFVFTLATGFVILLIMFFVFDVNMLQPLIFLAVALGTLGYVSVGTIFAALTATTRARESMLPILLLPVMVPVFVAGVALTATAIDARSLSSVNNWLGILAGFDLVFLGGGLLCCLTSFWKRCEHGNDDSNAQASRRPRYFAGGARRGGDGCDDGGDVDVAALCARCHQPGRRRAACPAHLLHSHGLQHRRAGGLPDVGRRQHRLPGQARPGLGSRCAGVDRGRHDLSASARSSPACSGPSRPGTPTGPGTRG
jgi:heme exporter protein B